MILREHLRSLGLSAGEMRKALETGKVWLQGAPTSDAGRDIDPADVELRPASPRLQPGRDVAIVHRDDHLVIVYKPAGLLAVPAQNQPRAKTVLGEVARICGAALPVHRLDEDTSGLMMVALNEPAQILIKKLVEAHEVERIYTALVNGRFQGERRVDAPLGRGPDGRRAVIREGQPAVTHVRALENLGRATVVECRLETGRTHQVRLHMAWLGHPVLDDPLYGKVGRGPGRLALHSTRISLRHPLTRQNLRVQIPLADDLERFRRSLLDH